MSAALPPASFTPEDTDRALFGRDATPRIVDVQPLTGGDEAAVRRYLRSADGQRVTSDVQPFYPFFFLSDLGLLSSFPRSRYLHQTLGGGNPYRHLIVFKSWGAYWDAIRHVERASESGEKRPRELYLVGNPVQQYLTQTGQTCFKGMGFDDLHRLQLDIETYTTEGFPNASRPGDRVIIVALSDNRGWSHLVHAKDQSEAALLRETLDLVRLRDPDVIEMHNGYAFDLPYLRTRCRRHGIPFTLGRDGTEPRTFPSSMRFAERAIEFEAAEIAGRHIVDTYFQVMSFDVFKRDLPGYGLKAAAKYFGFAPEGRTYVDGADIPRVWDDDPDRLLRYALDDVIETERLARHLSGSTFYLTQMLPMPYGQVARTGPASKIEALFVREYLRRRQSLPMSQWGSQTLGGYTDVFVTGVVGPIVYADVESLYPSIMLNYGVQPATDEISLFPALLQRLTDLRFEAKAAMKTTSDANERGEYDARQTSYKNLINSFYGSLGFGHAAFNDFAEADRVAAVGQDVLRTLMKAIREAGGLVIEVDTDGVLFVPPETIRGDAEERAFVAALSDALPEGIRVGFDGRFQTMLSYKKKNYALLGYDGTLKFKGSSLVSRSVERFGRRFVREGVRLLLDEDVQGLHDLFLGYRDRIKAHDWSDWDPPHQAFSKTETLKHTVAEYERAVGEGQRPRATSYELAKARAQAGGPPVRIGDRISYYLAGDSANTPAFEQAKFAEDWDPAVPDENTAYYLRRLDEFARKFATFFAEHDFRLVFSEEDLFGFSPDGITLLRTERPPEETDDTVPF